MPTPALRLLDTTLRDGADARDFAPGPDARHAIARALVDAGVDVIEVASADAPDVEAVRSLCRALGDVEACVIGPADSDAVAGALERLAGAARPRIHLYADVARAEGLPAALEAVFAARTNVEQVEFSPLRVFERPAEEVAEVALAAADSGATVLNLSDSNGRAEPAAVHALVDRVARRLGDGATLSFHGHDHGGHAVANAVAACRAGARQVHVCVAGLGPTGGNTALEALVAALDALGDDAPVASRVDRAALPALTRLVAAACP